jgi:biopolymer transport protein ExbD
MTPRWQVRHAGSPQHADLEAQAIIDGIRDGLWEPTDEVRAEGESDWQPLEAHPAFAEAIAELEQPDPPTVEETHLDFNPLIDVALVLLIFFILTTTALTLRKELDVPGVKAEEQEKAAKSKRLSKNDVVLLINIKARMEGGKPVVRVDGVPVEEASLTEELAKHAKKVNKTEAFLDAKDVPWGTIVAIMDAAKGAGLQQLLMRGPPNAASKD